MGEGGGVKETWGFLVDDERLMGLVIEYVILVLLLLLVVLLLLVDIPFGSYCLTFISANNPVGDP